MAKNTHLFLAGKFEFFEIVGFLIKFTCNISRIMILQEQTEYLENIRNELLDIFGQNFLNHRKQNPWKKIFKENYCINIFFRNLDSFNFHLILIIATCKHRYKSRVDGAYFNGIMLSFHRGKYIHIGSLMY